MLLFGMKTPLPEPGALSILEKLFCLRVLLTRLEESADRRAQRRLEAQRRPARLTQENLDWFLNRDA